MSTPLLIAADSGLQAQLLRRGLENAGYRVVEAQDGEEAYALAVAERPLAVVSDIRMPRKDGYDLCRAIRANASLSATPVILVSDLSDPLEVIRALDACADAFVTKPYDFDVLVSRIRALAASPERAEATGQPKRAKVSLAGDTHEISVDASRLSNMLLSVFETAVQLKRQLDVAHQGLDYMSAHIEQRVLEKTDRVRKRVRELKLLQRASRLLSERRFDQSALEELVMLMPSAWEDPANLKASISYRDITVRTRGWQPSRWRQSVSFATSGGTGRIEVAYVDHAKTGEISPFLAEEADVLDSLAELLAMHAERAVAEERRKSLEAQLRHSQRMEALGTLAGGIAHDFNNLLTAMGGHIELALDADPSDSVRESLDQIRQAYVRATDLAKRILMFGRRQETDRQPVVLSSVVEEALTLLRATIRRDVSLHVRCAPDVPTIWADASQMHQVVMNLATNAAHAMTEGGGSLTIAVDPASVSAGNAPSPALSPGEYVCMTVADTGAGITPEIIDRIFDPFFTTKGQGGSGLGLPVVDGIVRDHGGAVVVDSELGRGTTFRVYLPISGTPGMTPPRRGAGQHIMYVDDDEAQALAMSRVLESLGYRCTTYTDPQAAIQAFRAGPLAFDAALARMAMSGLSGVELARALHLERAALPVAIIAGPMVGQDAADAQDPRAHITKPTTIHELSTAISKLLRDG